MNNRKNIFAMIMIGVMIIASAGAVHAEDKKNQKPEAVVSSLIKSVTGKVTAIGKDYIAVAYQEDLKKGVEYEIFLPVGKDARIERKRKITDINVGDTVELSYEEQSKEYEAGKGEKTRKATRVSFISPAKKSPFSDEPDAEEGLNLKGLRGE